jgi:hypothetical protein
MAIDPYSLCPGGTGKKLKFCCHDLLSELDKIDRMLTGGQQQACLDYVAQLSAKHPGRACLQTTQSMLLHALGQDAEARRVAEVALEAQPGNPVALAAKALALIEEEGGAAAIRPLHEALAASHEISPRVASALEALAQSLLIDGHPMASLAHFLLLVALNPEHQSAVDAMMRIKMAPELPVPLKDISFELGSAPSGAPWKAEFDAAVELVADIRWFEAAERLTELSRRAPDAPAILFALGRLRAYLADNAGAADCLHHLATLAVPLDDAVEAEALAQLLDAQRGEPMVDEILVTYPIDDIEAVADKLARSAHLVRLRSEQIDWGDRDDPPPRMLFTLLDRARPETAAGLTVETVPEILGTLMLFGRQTDRGPRLGLMLSRPQLAQARDILKPIVGDLPDTAESEEVLGAYSAANWTLSGRLFPPADLEPEEGRRLVKQYQRRLLLERWPSAPHPVLNGQTPEQAARDPAQQVAVLAIIGLLEQRMESWQGFDELRERLKLPLPRPIDPRSTPLDRLPLVRMWRLDVAKLTDEDLRTAYLQSMEAGMRAAARRLAQEMISRPSFADHREKAGLHAILAMLDPESDEAPDHLDEARRISESAGESSAPWDLRELSLRIQRRELPDVDRLVRHIHTSHRNEPGVADQLLQILYEAGIVDESGRVITRGAPPAELAPAGPAEPAKIWTPESETGQQKSSLWIPGG